MCKGVTKIWNHTTFFLYQKGPFWTDKEPLIGQFFIRRGAMHPLLEIDGCRCTRCTRAAAAPAPSHEDMVIEVYVRQVIRRFNYGPEYTSCSSKIFWSLHCKGRIQWTQNLLLSGRWSMKNSELNYWLKFITSQLLTYTLQSFEILGKFVSEIHMTCKYLPRQFDILTSLFLLLMTHTLIQWHLI